MSAGSPIVMLLLMFAVFWFIVIRPQVKRQKEHQEMLSKLQKGDMVVTRGGMVGKASGLSPAVLTVEFQEKVRIRVLRSHVEGKYDPANAASNDAAKKAA